jgi:hypothetical protein
VVSAIEHRIQAWAREKLIYRIDITQQKSDAFWKDPFVIQLLQSIQKAIDSKSRKHYQGYDKLVICVYVCATGTPESELLEILKKVKLPQPKPDTDFFAFCRSADTPKKGHLVD